MRSAMRLCTLVLLLLLLLPPVAVLAAEADGGPGAAADGAGDAVAFVRQFYGDLGVRRDQSARWFEPKLAALLEREHRRAAHAKELCGFLDWDPFTATQDDPGQLKALAALPGAPLRIEVRFTDVPDPVVVELVRGVEGLRIANVAYPAQPKRKGGKPANLLSDLHRALAEKCP